MPIAKHLQVQAWWLPQPLPCKHHIHTYKRNLFDVIFLTLSLHPSWRPQPSYMLASLTHNYQYRMLTNLQKFSLLRPMPRYRYSISIRFQEHQQLWICWSSIPHLKNEEKKKLLHNICIMAMRPTKKWGGKAQKFKTKYTTQNIPTSTTSGLEQICFSSAIFIRRWSWTQNKTFSIIRERTQE